MASKKTGQILMPRGPRGEKRPADVIGNAVRIMRIATGEETEELDSVKSAASRAWRAEAAKRCLRHAVPRSQESCG